MDYSSRATITSIVYMTLLLDNILLTVIVPILPDFLQSFSNKSAMTPSTLVKSFDLHYIPNSMMSKHPLAGNGIRNITTSAENLHRFVFDVEKENGNVGILLAVKAFVQLFFNPFAGNLSGKFGHKNMIFFGTSNLLFSSLIFVASESFTALMLARAVEGIGSSCVNVCGMSMIAHLYPEDSHRSRIMGIVLGSVALGVLVGYPAGGFLYDFVSKSSPFIIIAFFLFIDLAFQVTFFDFSNQREEIEVKEANNDDEEKQTNTGKYPQWLNLLSNRLILMSIIAIWFSTSAMAVLEPLLPIWLIAHLHPKKWQLGTVFIPDSLGYFIGTNFFGSIAFRVGQVKMSVIAIMVVGLSCFVIPEAQSVSSLIIPHFCLGLGIGVLDTSLVPYLARLADDTALSSSASGGGESDEMSSSSYGSVYAIQQTAVSLAYSVVPFIGGELAQSVGFKNIMRFLGFLNFIYGPILLFVNIQHNLNNINTKNPDFLLQESSSSSYRKFYNSID